MLEKIEFDAARDAILAAVSPVKTEKVSLSVCNGRVLAQSVCAVGNVPPFDRSPYDGYAFRAEDVAQASRENPVTLSVLEEVAAGAVPAKTVTAGTAVKILTGAPIPAGADTVIKYEDTVFTADAVTIFQNARPGDNIVRRGEDVKAGENLALPGQIIDAGLAGVLAGQGVYRPMVYRRPKVAVISTGNEVTDEVEGELSAGKIRNTNRYMLETALLAAGCEPVYMGIAGDDAGAICTLLSAALETCDAAVLTGGVSVGDYDRTPAAMEMLGAEMLAGSLHLKPGGACAYGRKEGKLICGLSGNPASAMTNFYAVALPALRKLAGHGEPLLPEITVVLERDFRKNSPQTRILRGRLRMESGTVLFFHQEQGNSVIRSLVGCDALAVVPAGSGPLPAGTVLKGFRI